MSTMLYYPMINVPRKVLYQGLLYWDRIATLVPQDQYRRYLDTRMRAVEEAGLYLPLLPYGKYASDHQMIKALELLVDRRPNDLVAETGSDAPAHPVFAEKVDPFVLLWLYEKGLIGSDHTDTSGRVFVSDHTHICLMSLLARDTAARMTPVDGHLAEDALIPSTDHPAAHRLAYDRIQEDDRGQPCWNIELGGLLPTPRDEVPLHKLLAFREDHADERRRLRLAIDRLVHELHRDYEHPQDVFRLVRQELEQALADFTAAGKAKRIAWVTRSVALSVGLAAGYAGNAVYPKEGWLLGVINGYAINVASDEVRASRAGLNPDLGYLYRVDTAVRKSTF